MAPHTISLCATLAALLSAAAPAAPAAPAAAPATLQSGAEQAWWKPSSEPIPITRPLAVAAEFTTPVLIAKYGYPVETHTIQTSDGYLLGVHRIPNPGRPAVYLQHGILSSSADWVVLGPSKALGFILYDAGYDVWMGNFRGNSYSRAHATLSTKDNEFWDFSWHEIGMYDVPAIIDKVLDSTKQSQLVYIGHSQGTTAFFVTASMRPEYNEKVSAFIAMAPVVYLGNVRSEVLKIIAKAVNQIEFIAKVLGMGEFLPNSWLLSAVTTRACSDSSILQSLCTNILFLIAGFDSEELDTEKLPEIMQNVPAGSSTKQLLHYGQLMNSKKFRQFDYGFIKNIIRYKSSSPPKYPLEKITTKVYLHYADNDLLADPKDVLAARDKLPNVKLVRKVPHTTFNHLDFLYARDTRPLLYDEVMTSIQEVVGQEQ